MRPKLGVNIDHVATLRQQRDPSPLDLVFAARTCLSAGADSIVVHLREDRRHIQDKDVVLLRKIPGMKLNLEMSVAADIVKLACRVKPDQATLVPERRQELTTEGGLDVVKWKSRTAGVVRQLTKAGIDVSLFIEPDKKQIRAAFDAGARIIELHTGSYANSASYRRKKAELLRLREAALFAHSLGLEVNAGHGLDYSNVCPVASMPYMHELNIGYSIVAYALFAGLDGAVRKMKEIIG